MKVGISAHPVVNTIGFQLFWWTAILGQNQYVWLLIIAIGLHLYFHHKLKLELNRITFIALAGYTVDCVLTLLGVFNFHYQNNFFITPIWLIMLWLGFATTITTVIQKSVNNILVIAAIGMTFAPISYVAAAKLEAVAFPLPMLETIIILGFTWAVLLPLLIKLDQAVIRRSHAYSN